MKSTLVAFAGYALLFAAAVAIVTLTHSQPPASAERDSAAPASEEAALPPATPRPVSTGGAALRRQAL